jgi:hypothetical protein
MAECLGKGTGSFVVMNWQSFVLWSWSIIYCVIIIDGLYFDELLKETQFVVE